MYDVTIFRRLLAVLLCMGVFVALSMISLPAAAQQPYPAPTATPTPIDPINVVENPSISGIIGLVLQWGLPLTLVAIIVLVGLYFFTGYGAGFRKSFEKLGEKHGDKPFEEIDRLQEQKKDQKALDTGTASYLSWLQDELKHLPIIPIQSGDRVEQLCLQDVYVPLRVVERTQMESFRLLTMGEFDEGGEFRLRREAFKQLECNQGVYRLLSDPSLLPALTTDDDDDDDDRPRRRSAPSADEAYEQEQTTKNLLLVGDAGSGKTTTLHYGVLVLAHDYAQHTTTGARETLDLHCPQTLLPFYIRLTLVATHVRNTQVRGQPEDLLDLHGAPSHLLLDWLDHHICSQVKNIQRAMPDDLPSKRIADGGCVVLLDGLDETGDERERAYMQQLIQNLQQDYSNNRYLVASRPFDDLRLQGFEERHLSPMNGVEMQTLLKNWFGAMHTANQTHKQRERATDQQAHLWGILERNARLFEMATNPLLLTSMALLVYTGTGLPRQRARIYYELVDLLLKQWRIQQKADGLPGNQRSHPPLYGGKENEESVRRRLQTLAAWMQEHQRREIWLHEAQNQLRPVYEEYKPEWNREQRDDYVCTLLESLSLESGLVQRRDNGYSFAHYTLQEYLTARAYDERDDGVQGLFDHYHLRRWRETILLAVGHWANTGKPGLARQLLRLLLDTKDLPALLLAAAALDDADADRVLELSPLRNETIERLQKIAFFPDACPEPKTRNEAAELLDRLGGDNRSALDFTHADYWATRIEPGEFLLGDDNGKRDNEKPAIRFHIMRPYALARFPVTNRQYLAFLDDLEQQGRSEESQKRRPTHWSGKHYPAGEGNHPVVYVNWGDVTAFAAWLNRYLKANGILPEGDTIRLPTEPEWERAAAYPVQLATNDITTSKRIYPWGNEPPDTSRANTEESGIGGTSVVGIFPHGCADCGAEEMGGNVWEFCATPYMGYNEYLEATKLPVDGQEKAGKGRNHIQRGGSWFLEQMFSRCAVRSNSGGIDDSRYGVRLARLFS